MSENKERVAVVGAGVAGLTASWMLQQEYDVDLYEKNDYAGGHTRTITISEGPDKGTGIDTGFVVMNHRNYPLFSRVLRQLDVELGDSQMSFSFQCEKSGYTYAGTNLASMFAKPSNLLKLNHWRMLRDIRHFNRVAHSDLEEGLVGRRSLGEYLEWHEFSREFAEQYLLVMGAAIWSAPPAEMLRFPAEAFLNFFENHGLLTLNDRPQWRYVKNGSHQYVQKMLEQFKGKVYLNADITHVKRKDDHVEVELKDKKEKYDYLVLATHADQALRLLGDPSTQEQELLGAWRYQDNDVVLHTDKSVMPSTRKAWASWNTFRGAEHHGTHPVSVTYHMNRLHRLKTKNQYFVTLNRTDSIAADKIISQTTMTHPVFTADALATKRRLRELAGKQRTFFCGSYLGHGFHEDAVRSAVDVCGKLGIDF